MRIPIALLVFWLPVIGQADAINGSFNISKYECQSKDVTAKAMEDIDLLNVDFHQDGRFIGEARLENGCKALVWGSYKLAGSRLSTSLTHMCNSCESTILEFPEEPRAIHYIPLSGGFSISFPQETDDSPVCAKGEMVTNTYRQDRSQPRDLKSRIQEVCPEVPTS